MKIALDAGIGNRSPSPSHANRCDGSAIQADGHDLQVTGNVVPDFQFGGGITTNPSNTNHDNQIVGNTVYNGTGEDINNTFCGGIENWAARTLISGNICYHNSGQGIGIGARQCIVTNNICYDNGQSNGSNPNHAGIVLVYTSTSDASESVLMGNRCFDTGGGTQYYGIADLSSGDSSGPFSSNVTIGVNNLLGNATGETDIHGSNYAEFLHIPGGAVALSARSSEPADSDLNNSNISFWIDESDTIKRLKIKVKLSDGTPTSASIDLA
ncbi:MAG: hypothetical protein HY651_04270 [Acidobacteria bacterium]|nr:hypothetical protein [Acidobacteriota bacterium]